MSTYHASRLNLLIHLIAVPLFITGFFSLLLSLLKFELLNALFSFLLIAISLAAQSFGHAREHIRSSPVKGPSDAMTRILLEQLINFPLFLLSGRWYAALRDANRP
jgi:hypothetical protein